MRVDEPHQPVAKIRTSALAPITGANAPARLSGGPGGPLTRRYGVTVVNFLGIHTRVPAAKCALLKCWGSNQDQPFQLWPRPWSRPTPQSNGKRGHFGDYGVTWGPCTAPLARYTRLEKVSMRKERTDVGLIRAETQGSLFAKIMVCNMVRIF